MKNRQTGLNFQNDTITFLGYEILLITTSNGLYAIPITAAKQLLEKIDSQHPPITTLHSEQQQQKVKQREPRNSTSHLHVPLFLNQELIQTVIRKQQPKKRN